MSKLSDLAGICCIGRTTFPFSKGMRDYPHSIQQIVCSRHGGSKEKVEGEEGKESGEKIHSSCAHWNVNGMFVVEETADIHVIIDYLWVGHGSLWVGLVGLGLGWSLYGSKAILQED